MAWGTWITWWIISCISYSWLFCVYLKKHGENTVNRSVRTYINKMGNRITFKIKAWYYLELLTPGRMELLGSTKTKITKSENNENVPHLSITEVLLVHCNIFIIIIIKIQESFICLFQISHFVNYKIFHKKNLYFQKLLTQNFHILKYGLQIIVLNR